MEIHDKLVALGQRIPDLVDHLQTEEAAKQALVLPFISALGYNVFDPTQVVPEYTADVGGKRGEKVDYAIMRNGSPVVLVECKQSEADLAPKHMAQLFRYFVATEAKIGILTNGIVYQFFTDLEDRNKMDETPFLVLDLRHLDEETTKELERLTEDEFDLEGMVNTALELRYRNGMQAALERQLAEPDSEFVRWLAQQVYSGRLTASVFEQFKARTHAAFRAFIRAQVNDAVRRVIDGDHDGAMAEPSTIPVNIEDARGIETTLEEIEGYVTVKQLLEGTVARERVFMRDSKSYCAILLDDNNRKPICRLRFGDQRKRIGLLDEDKHESVHDLESLDDIRLFADQLREAAIRYM